MEVECTFDHLACLGYGEVGWLAAVDRNELGNHVRWDLWRCEVLEKCLQVRKIEVVGPLGNTELVTAMVVFANRYVVDGAETVDSDQG